MYALNKLDFVVGGGGNSTPSLPRRGSCWALLLMPQSKCSGGPFCSVVGLFAASAFLTHKLSLCFLGSVSHVLAGEVARGTLGIVEVVAAIRVPFLFLIFFLQVA